MVLPDYICPHCQYNLREKDEICPKCIFKLTLEEVEKQDIDYLKEDYLDLLKISFEEDRYVWGKFISSGGSSKIYEVYDNKLNRTVVGKTIQVKKLDNETVERFAKEATITSQLEHPNIIPIHDFGLDDEDNLYIIMKYIKGETLSNILSKIKQNDTSYIKKFSLPSLLNIFSTICNAIAYAHSKKIVHRDLKPDNIMIGEFSECWVLDWGIYKVLQSKNEKISPMDHLQTTVDQNNQTLHGSILGTPDYLSPEQALGQASNIDERTDIFGLGSILYEILTLREPIEGDTLNEKLKKAKEGIIIPPHEYLSQKKHSLNHHYQRMNRTLSELTMKCLAKDPKLRYNSVIELKDDIVALQNGHLVSIHNRNVATQLWLFIKRNKQVSLTIIIFLTITLSFQAINFYHLHQEHDNLLTIAKKNYQNHNYEQAILKLEKAYRRYPNSRTLKTLLQWYQEKAESELQFKNWNTAILYLQKLLNHTPDNKEIIKKLEYALGIGEIRLSAPFEAVLYKKVIENGTSLSKRKEFSLLENKQPLKLKANNYIISIFRDKTLFCYLPISINRGVNEDISIPSTFSDFHYRYIHKGYHYHGDQDVMQFDNTVGYKKMFLDSFMIMQQPVTIQQYLLFTQSDQYQLMIEKVLKENNLSLQDLDSDAKQFSDLNNLFNYPFLKKSHPYAIGISYYEALAYAYSVGGRLPTEFELEKVMKGPDQFYKMQNINHSRKFNPYYCSGLFGRIWIWTSSPYKSYFQRKVVKGGGDSKLAHDLKASRRKALDPKVKYTTTGFIVCKDIIQ